MELTKKQKKKISRFIQKGQDNGYSIPVDEFSAVIKNEEKRKYLFQKIKQYNAIQRDQYELSTAQESGDNEAIMRLARRFRQRDFLYPPKNY